ncbi:hypothetical protein NOR_02847 [Metarhizium rileyi]|uniref:Uncharacterized protein n=1 Tax=Metarhizium rileyi (strain RCEF 4871) TaxID=1649241 RepID=A0A167G328_METRR|nr:hypothetical protein NOR_02847 [Metarhizium rileyi RCEF 4871]
MKATARLVVIASLVSLVTAEALPPKEVPVQCAAICGPVVDLSSKCTPLGSTMSELGGMNMMNADEMAHEDADGSDQDAAYVAADGEAGVDLQRRFIVLVSAPTTFPAKYSSLLNGDADGDGEGTASETNPSAASSPSPSPDHHPLPIPAAAPAVLSSPDASPSPTPSTAGAQDTSSSTVAPPAKMTSSAAQGMDGEEQCFCLNKSFDVMQVAALCTSCILQAGDAQTNMRTVLSVCGFAEANYAPANDSIVANIRVEAKRPATGWGHNAGVSSRGRRRCSTAGLYQFVAMAVLSAVWQSAV